MEHNVGTIDKAVRVLVGLALFWGAYLSSGWLVWLLVVLGVASIATAAVGFCGLYTLFGWNTCPVKIAAAKKKKR